MNSHSPLLNLRARQTGRDSKFGKMEKKVLDKTMKSWTFENIIGRLVETAPHGEFIRTPKNYPRSPLRYPGGKNRAIKSIFSCIPENETDLCSPFLGGASLELVCTATMKIHGSDVFEPLIAFWKTLLVNPEALARKVEKYYPLSKSKFYSLQKRYMTLDGEIERAAAFYVLNRSSFSGTTLSGGMSPGHPRFTESSIQRLRDFHVNNFEVECADFRDVIPAHKDSFLYLDPPYLNGQSLYGLRGDTHKDFDHKALAGLLLKRDRWIMSYNDCEEIRKVYEDNPILSVEWIYGMSKDKKSSEILVLSRDLAA
jgi:DNA adenine methylase